MDKLLPQMEKFITSWNSDFPDYQLKVADLKTPHSVIGSLFKVFDRLGIDREAVVKPPSEENLNEHTIYYSDLLIVINMTRVSNHLIAVMPQFNAKVLFTNFLQPTAPTSHSILMLLYNFMMFNEDRLKYIKPYEDDLFSKTDEVKALEDEKNKLLQMLNDRAVGKASRVLRLENLDKDTNQIEEDMKLEKEGHGMEKQELEGIAKEYHQLEILLEQNKSQRDAVTGEIEKKEALRVYDADDVTEKAENATQNVQEAEERLNMLRATLLEKENKLMNLQNIKPNLDAANNMLHEFGKVADSLRDCDADVEIDGELEVRRSELEELEAQLSELTSARAEDTSKRLSSQARRQQEKALLESVSREAEDKDRKCLERCKLTTQRVQDIKEATTQYELDKTSGLEALASLKRSFVDELNNIENLLLKKTTDCIQTLGKQNRSG